MYEDQTHEVILDRILNRIPDDMDKREGSIAWDMSSPEAMEFAVLYAELDNIIKNSHATTAEREYLKLICADRGITPIAATYAELEAIFTPALDTSVLIGKRFNINELNYVVTDVISETQGTYKIQCETAGEVGNKYLGSMLPIEYIDGLETAKIIRVLVPGEDEEDTESLRSRYLASFDDKGFAGNRADYISKVESLPGIGSCKVIRAWNSDIRPADMIPTTKTKEWYANAIKTMQGEPLAWLESVFTAASEGKLTVGGTVRVIIVDSDDYGVATDELVNEAQKALDPLSYTGEGHGLVPIGHVVSVRSAVAVSISITTKITFAEGYSWSTLKGHVTKAMTEYMLELRKEWGDSDNTVVRISQIETRILALDGVIDISDTTINGNASNLVLDADGIPVLGSVTADDT